MDTRRASLVMELVNPASCYVFDHPIDVHGVPMRGALEKQGVRFSAAGWRAVKDGMPTGIYSADDYGTMQRQQLRPASRPVLERARVDYAARHVPDFPRYHIIEPTSICNRACPFCPISALNPSRAAKRRLDWVDALAFFAECGRHEVYGLSLYQLGEPLLWCGHDADGQTLDLSAMVRAAKTLGGFKAVNVSTNGDVPNLEILLTCPVDDVIISIDGVDVLTYLRNRPSTARNDFRAFERTVTRVKAFLVAKHDRSIADAAARLPYVRLQIINKANTAAEIPAFIRRWIGVPGVDDVFVKNLDGMVPWVGNGAVAAEESAAKLAQVTTLPCQHLWTIGSMTAEGVLNACCHDARTELTDGSHIGTTSMATFWHGPFLTALRTEHQHGVFRSPCATCTERDVWLG